MGGRRGKDKAVFLVETTKKILKGDFCIQDGAVFEKFNNGSAVDFL